MVSLAVPYIDILLKRKVLVRKKLNLKIVNFFYLMPCRLPVQRRIPLAYQRPLELENNPLLIEIELFAQHLHEPFL